LALQTHESRPNISIQVTRRGTVELGDRRPAALRDRIPSAIDTEQTRSFTVIKDGLLNIDMLPVKLTPATWEKLAAERAVPATYSPDTVVIDLARLPIVNAQMVQKVSAKAIFETQHELIKARCAAKVFGFYVAKNAASAPSKAMLSAYGAEAVEWLEGVGFTDSGFSPKTVAAEPTDVYRSKEIHVSLKGLSSAHTTKMQEVSDRLAALDRGDPKAKKLTPGQAFFEAPIREVQAMAAAPIFVGPFGAVAFAEWLDRKQREAQKRVRDLLAELAQAKFAIAVGQVWPHEFASLDENTMTLPLGSAVVLCTLEMNEPEVRI
jgi:hypothetical protein